MKKFVFFVCVEGSFFWLPRQWMSTLAVSSNCCDLEYTASSWTRRLLCETLVGSYRRGIETAVNEIFHGKESEKFNQSQCYF